MDKIEELLNYYLAHRGVGHTTLMMHGVHTFEGPIIIMTHTSAWGRKLAGHRRNIHIVPWDSFDYQLRGLNLPIAIDNSAMIAILGDALEEIRISNALPQVAEQMTEYYRARVTALDKQRREAYQALAELKKMWIVRFILWLKGVFGGH